MYKLIAIDLDGTLLASDTTISKRNKQVISAAVSKGVYITLATGRMFSSALPFALDLGLDVPLITDEGSLVRTIKTRQTLLYEVMPTESVHGIISFAADNQLQLNVFVDDHLYVEKESIWLDKYLKLNKVSYTVVSDMYNFVQVHKPNKLVIVSDQLDVITGEVKRLHGDKLRIVRPNQFFLVLASLAVSKGRALCHLATRLNIDISETMAIGDSENDICMLEQAGLGIAMANASPLIKAVSDYTTASNDEDGVAEAIERFVLC